MLRVDEIKVPAHFKYLSNNNLYGNKYKLNRNYKYYNIRPKNRTFFWSISHRISGEDSLVPEKNATVL